MQLRGADPAGANMQTETTASPLLTELDSLEPPPQPETQQRILIVRLSSMGDILHTLPAVTLLRHAFPLARIGWMVEERWAELLCAPRVCRSGPRSPARPLVDAVHVVNTTAWRAAPFSDKSWKEALLSWREMRAAEYNLAIDFQGAVRTAVMARCTGIARLVGFEQSREHAASLFYKHRLQTNGTHVIDQAVSVAAALAGVPAVAPQIELPLELAAENWCRSALRHSQVQEFAILNPGAGWGAKQWPAERYGQVAKGLATLGLHSLVNLGPGEEELARTVENASHGAAEAVPCSLSELIALTRRARLFIGGDTGPVHLAAALQVPVVGIFGPTNPARSGPFGTHSIVLRSPDSRTTQTARRAAARARRNQPDPGILTITVEDVLAAARQLLGSTLA
jgi:heptosyltransferase-1